LNSAAITLFLIIVLFLNIPAYCQKDSSKIRKDSVAIKDYHPQDSPPNSGFEIKLGDSVSYLKIMGSVRLNGAYDFNGLQTKSSFSTYDIPVGSENTNDTRFYMGAYQSRIAFEIYRKTYLGNVFAKVEADFQGSDNNFRLRLAYGVIGYFLLGKAWSVFGDPEAVPQTVDKDGPNSSVVEKAIQIRFEPGSINFWRFAVALETPNVEITNTDTVQADPFFQSFPDFTARVKYGNKSEWGHIQLASVFRSITVRDPDENLQILAGYGGLLSGRIIFKKSYKINFQFVGGKGISNYIKALNGTGLDAVYNPQEGIYKLLTSYGGFLSLTHQWNKLFASQVTSGSTFVVNQDFQPPDAFRYSYYFSFNSFFNYSKVINFGLEYSYGERINKDDESGNANRISFISIIDF
jgi:hypothetical protein